MADRPIIFSAPMIRALLCGRKTQTRRVLRPQPPEGLPLLGIYGPGLNAVWGVSHLPDSDFAQRLPYAPGDRLWVREAWETARAYDDLEPSAMAGEEPIRFSADDTVQAWGWPTPREIDWGRRRPGMFMPRWASRLTLTVTDVSVERLQDISEADAVAEGAIRIVRPSSALAGQTLPRDSWAYGIDPIEGTREAEAASPIEAFELLWDRIHGPGAWDQNPWVCALTFRVERRNIDAEPAAE